MLLERWKSKHRNMSMAWIDYRKAFDSVPHNWTIKSLELCKVLLVIINFLKSKATFLKGRLKKSTSIELDNSLKIKELEQEEVYKFLGVNESNQIQHADDEPLVSCALLARLKMISLVPVLF